MTDLPQAAIDAATDMLSLDRPVTWDIIARDILEAAAPHIAAAERARIRQLAIAEAERLRADRSWVADPVSVGSVAAFEDFANLLTEGTTT